MRISTSTIGARLMRLGAEQDHVVCTRDLRRLGISGSGLSARRDRGLLQPLMPGVHAVAVAPEELDRRGWEMAALLRPRTGPVVLSHASAARRLGLWEREPDDAPIHVLCTGAASTTTPPASGVVIVTHRTRELDSSDAWRDGRAWIATAERACLDMGAMHTPLQLTYVMREAVHRGLLDMGSLRERVDASPNVPGTRTVREAIRWYDRESAGTRSRTEDEFQRLVEAAGLPLPLVNVRNATGMPGVEADFVWREPRVVVEVDGGHHQLPGAHEFDALRDEALRAAGWIVIRVPWRDVWTRPWDVIAEVHRALGHCTVAPQTLVVPERPVTRGSASTRSHQALLRVPGGVEQG